MRLQEISYLIHNTLANWVDPQMIDAKKPFDDISLYTCDNVQAITQLLDPLQIFPFLDVPINQIIEIIDVSDASSYISEASRSMVRDNMRIIKSNLLIMEDMLKLLHVEPNCNGFDVKLPPNITLENLIECTKDLNTLFSQCPLFQYNDVQISLSGVDVGSSWLTFIVKGTGLFIVLRNLASLVDKVVHIRSHWLTCKKQEEECKKLGIANDLLGNLADAHNAVLKKLQENAVEELSSQNSITDPESKARLNYSIDLMNKMMSKGLEIYAAIGSEEEIKSVFPTVEQQALPGELPKLLQSSDESDKAE